MSRGRSYNRSKDLVHKNKARLILRERFGHNDDLVNSPKTIGITARTKKICSCWMCGNQRKHHGRPISEIRNLGKMDDDE